MVEQVSSSILNVITQCIF